MSNLEQQIIACKREAIASLPGPMADEYQARSRKICYQKEVWEDDTFIELINGLDDIYRSYWPHERGQWRTIYIGVGYSSHEIREWIPAKVQPARPAVADLVNQANVLIATYELSQRKL